MSRDARTATAHAMASSASEGAGLAAVSAWAAGEFGADNVAILLPGPRSGLELRAYFPDGGQVGQVVLGRGTGLAGHVAETGEPVAVPAGLASDPRHAVVPVLDDTGFESAVAAPIPLLDGSLGVLLLRKRQAWPEADRDLVAAAASADELGRSLGVYRAAFEAGSQANVAGLLTELADTVSGVPYLEEILDQLVRITARRFNYPVVTLRLLDSKREHLVLRAVFTRDRSVPREPMIRLGQSIAGRVAQLGKTETVEDVLLAPDFIGHEAAKIQGVRSMVCVPLVLHGRSSGVMSCYAGEVRQFPPEEVAALQALAKQAAVSIEHGKLQARDTLLQEMHHRVKNNLQQVASLLRIELGRSEPRPAEEALRDTLQRIEAIASVHELLSRDDLDHVSLTMLAGLLVQGLQQSVVPPGKSVQFSVGGSDVHLDTVRATQLALVLNELIQNAVKHGFRQTDQGEVHVTLEQQGGRVGVWVSNNGDPLPSVLDDGASLGLQIIRSLARSLGGEFRLYDKAGWTIAELTFPQAAFAQS